MHKKIGISIAMACLLVMGSFTAWAGSAQPEELTGKQWVLSSTAEKLSFLYGASSIIAIEDMGAMKAQKPASRFVKGWMKAFKNTTLPEMQSQIDAWYAAHPDQQDRHVLSVIWYELIEPAQKK